MASIAKSSGGSVRVFFYDKAGRRKAVHLGRVSDDIAEGVCRRVERILNAQIHGEEPSRNDSEWLAKSGLRKKFVAVGLVEPLPSDSKAEIPTLEAFLRGYIERRARAVKPASVTVWTQVQRNLLDLMPKDIRLDKITVGHAKDFHESLRAKGMKTSTISKRIGFCRQFLSDAVDRELIPKNPFASVDAPRPKLKSNTFVNRGIIERIMAKANTRWRVIVALSRFGGLRTPSETLSLKWSHIDWERDRMHIPEPKVEHHEGRGVRECPLFPELRTILEEAFEIYGESSEYVVDADEYRAAANTDAGWKNANLRTQFMKLLAKAGVEPWPRVFHSMRASRQTELVEAFPSHVVCSWLGNSEEVAKSHYLLVTDEHFQAAAETQAERVINPTQQGEKTCDKSDSAGRTQGTRKEPFGQGKRREKGGFRQLLLVLEAEDKGFEHPSKTSENPVVFQKRVINPTQEHAETLAELLDIIADADAETLAELLRMAKQTREPSKASGGR